MLALALLAFAPRVEEPVERFVTALHRWIDGNPQEKVYLHMDKSYYAVGDTVWFKAYVTVGSRHQLSKLSGALYVELIDERDSLLSSVKLPLTAGMAMGDFTLGDEYKAGNFRIRAYTQWMRNAGPEYFFDHTFAVGDLLGTDGPGNVAGKSRAKTGQAGKGNKSKTNLLPDSLSKSDVQFFPEGGNLLYGINSRIGFKAVGINGRGVAVKGTVVDQTGEEITSFESLHAGMGVFNIRPQAGKSYSAKLTFADGSGKIIALPRVADQGYTLAVFQPNRDSVLVRIKTVSGTFQTPRSVSLVAQSGGETIFASQVTIAKVITSVWIPKREFPTGIAQFTIFDGRGEPVNERISFIKNNDGMELHVSSAKKTYKSREKVTIDLESINRFGDAVPGNFSVSVTDESKVPFEEANENTILSGLLLSSDIKGYIEQPNYYFTNESYEVNKALDNLMLTQGYRRFAWKEITGTTSANKPLYKAESLGTEISGRVLTLSGTPVVNGEVTLMSLSPGFVEKVRTDADGKFAYKPIMLADSLKFAVQGRTAKNGKKTEVILDEVPEERLNKNKNKPAFSGDIGADTKVYLENSKKQDELFAKKGGLNRVNRLKEVQIKATVPRFGNTVRESQVDQVFRPKKDQPCRTLKECIEEMDNNRSVNFVFANGGGWIPLTKDGKAYTVMADGFMLDSGDYDNFLMSDGSNVDKIYFSFISRAVSFRLAGGRDAQYVMAIYTKSGNFRSKYTPGIVNIKPKGFNKAKEFYSPRYDVPGIGNQLPDLRSTVYWNPKIKTFASGRASFSFFNADGPGNYKVVVEGINAAGELARQVYRYEVEGDMQAGLPDAAAFKSNDLVKAIQRMQQRMPAEKLYVHTDKSYYNLGDTIWFKAYLFDAATLTASKRSALLYIELNSDTAESVKRISIPINEGTGYAQIGLSKKLFREGGYTLRAYTNWMQNFGVDYFFTKRFYLGVPSDDSWLVRSASKIGKSKEKEYLQTELFLSNQDQSPAGLRDVEVRVLEGDRLRYKEVMRTGADGKLNLGYELKEKADGRNIRLEIVTINNNDGRQRLIVPLNVRRNQNIDLQFLPEGGKLVAGLKSTVGIKALGEDGKGMSVSGALFDSKNNQVAAFSSLYKGMGSFDFIPAPGETYTARLTVPKDTEKTFKLPSAAASGTVLAVVNPERNDSLIVNVQASPGINLSADEGYLIGTSRGIVTYAQQLDGDINKYKIAKSLFPAGITRFTVFINKIPVNERIVFIDQPEPLRITISTERAHHYKREKVDMEIFVKDKNGLPVKGSFSVAVTDSSQVNADTLGNYGISASLLLNADLKGDVENPGYYLQRRDTQSWHALDNLMLTQGWTGYDWKDAFAEPRKPEFEGNPYFRLKGTVVNAWNKPVRGAQMLISSQKPAFIAQSLTDTAGRYVFENLPRIDSGSFFIQARTPKGRSMNFGAVSVDKFTAMPVPENFRDQMEPWYVNSDETQLNYVRNMASVERRELKLTGNLLKEVKINSQKTIRGSYRKGGSDIVFDEADIKAAEVMDLYELLRQKLPGFKVIMKDGFPAVMFNNFYVKVSIDGNGLPFELPPFPSIEEVISEMKRYQVASFIGVQVIYSRKYTNSYFTNSPVQAASASAEGYQGNVNFNTPGGQSYTDWRLTIVRGDGDRAVIEITTRNKSGWIRNNRPDFATYRPLPVTYPKDFYSPKYAATARDNVVPDYRSTIFWKPDVTTDVNGKATFSFYTSDVTGNYTVNIQGSDMDGNIGSTASTVKVFNQAP